MANKSAKPNVARRRHPFGSVKRPEPRYTAGYDTPLQRAANALQINSDRQLQHLLGYRVATHTIRNWRRGFRTTPIWALDIIGTQITDWRNRLATAAFEINRAKEKAGD